MVRVGSLGLFVSLEGRLFKSLFTTCHCNLDSLSVEVNLLISYFKIN